MRLKLSAISALLFLLPSACQLFDAKCGPEFRETSVNGEIRDQSGALLGSAEPRLIETRGDSTMRRLHLVVMGTLGSAGAPLKGHVRAARLVATTGEVLHEFPVAPGLADQVLVDPDEVITDAAKFDTLRYNFLAQTVVLMLETDLLGSEALRVPLLVWFAGDWGRAACS